MGLEVDTESIELKALNIFCHNGQHGDMEIKDRVALDMIASVYHIERCEVLHKLTPELFRIVFKDVDAEAGIFGNSYVGRKLRNEMGSGYKHVMGRIDMSLKFLQTGRPHYHQYPEASLHPSACCNLGDLFIRMSNLTEEEIGTTHRMKRYDAERLKPIMEELKKLSPIEQLATLAKWRIS